MTYTFLWWVLKLFIGLPWRLRFVGRENVPASGPVVFAANHESYVDPVIVAMGMPVHPRVSFMAKAEMWKSRPLGWLAGQLTAFPVERGTADRNAIATATRILDGGGRVGIFPQGTRHHAHGLEGLEEGAGGTALIALRASAPVVPVGIYGTDRIRPEGTRFLRFPRLTVVYGAPIDPADIPEGPRRERVEALTARIMEGIAASMREAAERSA